MIVFSIKLVGGRHLPGVEEDRRNSSGIWEKTVSEYLINQSSERMMILLGHFDMPGSIYSKWTFRDWVHGDSRRSFGRYEWFRSGEINTKPRVVENLGDERVSSARSVVVLRRGCSKI